MFNLKKSFQFLLTPIILLLISIFFLEDCNLVKCGNTSCQENNDFVKAVLWRLATRPGRPGLYIEAVNLSGASDDPANYRGFAGAISKGSGSGQWNEQAVRDVLRVFAYGGAASDADITAWANMEPSNAIVEMLGMWTVHSKLANASSDGNLSINPIEGSLSRLSHIYGTNGPATSRSDFDQKSIPWNNSPARTFTQAVPTRGLNPFRQKIAFFETNYHLALNQDKNVTDVQMFRHYDTVANDLARSFRDNLGYEDVLANMALSAPVATQYNHKKNVCTGSVFSGNEDFAREYHQLYFGILGVGTDRSGLTTKDAIPSGNAESFNSHEQITIPQTARALSDIQVVQLGNDSFSDIATFGTTKHCSGNLSIYAQTNQGSTAEARIKSLSKLSIAHPESKAALPLIIISNLADENLDSSNPLVGTSSDITTKIANIQALWNSMSKKNLIEFIRKYAISSMFHNTTRVKYLSTFDRTLLNANLTVVSNNELLNGLVRYDWEIASENTNPFRPDHDVFGGQTGLEASNTDDVFRNANNTSVSGQFGATGIWRNGSFVRIKDYRNFLPKQSDITADEIAKFLWRRIIGDATYSYFGALERAHIVSILSTGRDLNYMLCGNVNVSACSTKDNITAESSITSGNNATLINNAASTTLFRTGSTTTALNDDNDRVGAAIDFILTNPFTFVQVGK
ncbi:MAG TPA: hypothetical protein PK079_19320 [Leptospiraceae bacterium]|nr:hypothetical protein [Leptospiraceae bacterium]HMW05613.1 hypothetical protein [Leptospiraceae bacterium]HMY31122.1 hypothetical protein [Leptospiraceae bacterium]HMZ63705.1 hypothetical protein [Leptospiraceae bacterium]HNA09048.1 hypothetical protein [Leptospiraceae bacterium]